MNRLAVPLVSEGRLPRVGRPPSPSRPHGPAALGWVWQVSCLRWFGPPTRSTAGQSGEGRTGTPTAAAGSAQGRQVQEREAGRSWAESPTPGRTGVTFPTRAGLGGGPAAEETRSARGERARTGSRSVQPGRGPGVCGAPGDAGARPARRRGWWALGRSEEGAARCRQLTPPPRSAPPRACPPLSPPRLLCAGPTPAPSPPPQPALRPSAPAIG